MSLWKYSLSQNSNEKISGFLPWNFCSFLGASWKLFGLPGDLVSNIRSKEAYRKPPKLPGSPQEATKNFRAEIQKFFRCYFGRNYNFIRTFWLCLTFSTRDFTVVCMYQETSEVVQTFCGLSYPLLNRFFDGNLSSFFAIFMKSSEKWFFFYKLCMYVYCIC